MQRNGRDPVSATWRSTWKNRIQTSNKTCVLIFTIWKDHNDKETSNSNHRNISESLIIKVRSKGYSGIIEGIGQKWIQKESRLSSNNSGQEVQVSSEEEEAE